MRRFSELVDPQLLAACGRLRRLQAAFRATVPPQLYRHCAASHLADATLTVACDSAAWAARLRMTETELVRQLTMAMGQPVTGIRVLVRPVSRPAEPAPTPPRRPIPAWVGARLRAIAEDVGDAGLRRALLRLAAQSETDGDR